MIQLTATAAFTLREESPPGLQAQQVTNSKMLPMSTNRMAFPLTPYEKWIFTFLRLTLLIYPYSEYTV
jgi:hypothetical protein